MRFATGRHVDVIVVLPRGAHAAQGGRDARALAGRPTACGRWSEFAERIPRLADLERSYRDLWKFYVFAASDDPALLAAVAEIAAGEFPEARNVYHPGERARRGAAP